VEAKPLKRGKQNNEPLSIARAGVDTDRNSLRIGEMFSDELRGDFLVFFRGHERRPLGEL
jgi:hypothetical protein